MTVALLLAAVAGPAVLMIASATTLVHVRAGAVEACAVSALTGFTVGLVLTLPTRETLILMPLAVLGCAAAVVDAREGRLPDRLTTPLLACTLLATLLVGDLNTVALAATGAAGAALLKIAASAVIGWGDVKLVPTLALVLAHSHAVARGVLLIAAMVVLTAVVVGLTGARTRTEVVPYGPALVLGTIAAAAL